MTDPRINVLYEDNHILALDKPAGLATMGTAAGRENLLTLAKAYIKHKHNKPGEVYLGIVSRLDAPVTGVVLIARTSKAAARLAEQFRAGSVTKEYLAVVSGRPRPAKGRSVVQLIADPRHRRVHVAQGRQGGGQEARLEYQTLRHFGPDTLLLVKLETGRKHQIRVQLSHLGHPIIGDRKYGGHGNFSPGIALHSWRLVFRHPTRKSPCTITAPLPASWRSLGIDPAKLPAT